MTNNKRVIDQERAKSRSKELVSVVAVFVQRQFLHTKRRRDVVIYTRQHHHHGRRSRGTGDRSPQNLQ